MTRLLLDTHVLIWHDLGAPLAPEAARAIQEAALVHVSAVVAWEVAIKTSLGKLTTTRTVREACAESGFLELPLLMRHGELLGSLPWHHRDPFDRMMVAQAIAEGLTIVTRDRIFDHYDVPILRA